MLQNVFLGLNKPTWLLGAILYNDSFCAYNLVSDDMHENLDCLQHHRRLSCIFFIQYTFLPLHYRYLLFIGLFIF